MGNNLSRQWKRFKGIHILFTLFIVDHKSTLWHEIIFMFQLSIAIITLSELGEIISSVKGVV